MASTSPPPCLHLATKPDSRRLNGSWLPLETGVVCFPFNQPHVARSHRLISRVDTALFLAPGPHRAVVSPFGASLRRYFPVKDGAEIDLVWGYGGAYNKKGGQGMSSIAEWGLTQLLPGGDVQRRVPYLKSWYVSLVTSKSLCQRSTRPLMAQDSRCGLWSALSRFDIQTYFHPVLVKRVAIKIDFGASSIAINLYPPRGKAC